MPIDPTLTNLSDKDMSSRDLRGVSFARMRCMRANFAGSDLRGCDFREADCTGAIFSGANLEGADFRGAIDPPAQTIEEAPYKPAMTLEEENALLRQQLDDALAEIRRLQQPTIMFDGSSAVVSGPTPPAVLDMMKEAEQERPTKRRRSAKNGENH